MFGHTCRLYCNAISGRNTINQPAADITGSPATGSTRYRCHPGKDGHYFVGGSANAPGLTK
jgi:hypothetical protein